ncbi:MAG TPA: ABC transporter substrate-binding protein [Candidatus Babeliales bacterium]|nr:ABC transporter substrate-binding protein [Candidatus Babeliales bacterium]
MNKFTLTCIAIFAISITFVMYYLFKQQSKKQIGQSYRIAIFEPASHPAMDEIVQGFMQTIQNNSSQQYTFERYNANGNTTLLRAQAEEIIHRNYDLIMTIGTDPTRTIHELTTKKSITTPVVFTAVSDPVALGIIASRTSSGNNVTGVEEVPSYEKQFNKLLQVKPYTKNILLVYDPIIKSGIHEVWAQRVKQVADKKNITIHYAKVFHINEIQAKVQPFLQNIDTVLIFTDHTTVSGIDSLITLCNRYGVTLYASDLNSGDKGAALSYGVKQYDLGVDAGFIALRIAEKNEKPTDIPIVEPTAQRLKINTAVAHQQGLVLSDIQRNEIEKEGGIFV